MKITDNSGVILCPNPIELTIEEMNKFSILGVDCDTLFKSSEVFDGKCGEYIILKVINPKTNIEDCIEPEICAYVISFIDPVRENLGDKTKFLLGVSNNNHHIVQFEIDGVWRDANLSTNSYLLEKQNTSSPFTVRARIKGCEEAISQTLNTFPPSCVDTVWVSTGESKCENSISYIEQESNCGNKRFVLGGNACDNPCVPNWQDKSPTQTECINGFVNVRQTNGCTPASERWRVTSEACGGCEENWQNVSPVETDCIGGFVYYKQTNGCIPEETRWQVSSETCGGGGGEHPEGMNILMSYTLPSSENTTNFNQFPTLTMPNDHFKIVAAHGFPFYGATSADAMNLINRGWTNLFAAESYPRTPSPGWDEKALYSFNLVYRLMTIAARDIYKGGHYTSAYGNLNGIAKLTSGELADLPSINTHLDVGTNLDISGLTTYGAHQLGIFAYRVIGAATSPETPDSWGIPMTSGIMMLDEEHLDLGQTWEGGNTYTFLGYFSKGMKDEAISQGATNHHKIIWYGKPFNTFINSLDYNNPQGYTKAQIEGMFNAYSIFDSNQFRNHEKYIDADGSYYKVPYIDNRYEIWKKSGGNYVLTGGGQRVPVDTDYTITHYQRTMTIRKEPTINIQTLLEQEGTGAEVYCQAIDPDTGAPYGTWDGVKWNINPVSYSNGWRFENNAQPNSLYWVAEGQYFIRGVYARADGIFSGLMLAKAIDTSRASVDIETPRFPDGTNKTFLATVHRPQTENWSAFGNDHTVREVGPQGIIFDTLLALTSGVHLLDSWDDGHKLNYPLPLQGESIYSPDLDNGAPKAPDYWGRWVSKSAAFQSLLKKVEGTNPSTWKHIHFYYPCWGHKNSETIASGLYVGNKFYLLAANPTLGKDEVMDHTLKVGASTFLLKLVGRDPVFLEYTVPTGLNGTQFTLDYHNIYGVRIHVNGKLTKNIDDHYLS